MRILHLTNTFKADGTGITNVVADLSVSQARSGHSVTIGCAETDASMRQLASKYEITLIDGLSAHGFYAIARAAHLLRTTASGKAPEVVHVHTVRATLMAAIAFPRLFFTSSVSTIHNGYQRSVLAMCVTRTVVCVSEGDASLIRKKSFVRRPVVVKNGNLGSTRLCDIGKVVAEPLVEKAIVYVGALITRKGVDVLLRSMVTLIERHPGVRLYLVGNRDNPSLEKMAVELAVADNVEFVGFRSDPRSYMLGASVFVLPSRAEPFGLVLVEARECGVPIVASDTGGIPEVLFGGKAGLLVTPGDAQALAHTLDRVLRDADLAKEMRLRSREGIDVFAVGKMARGYENVYGALPFQANLACSD
ncbi:MAG: glycosyltransferase family 4 protein [Janthinobacterium lividum]